MPSRPYPFDALPRLPRSDADRLTAWARGGPVDALVSNGESATSWLGAPIAVRPSDPTVGGAPPLDAAWPTAWLVRARASAALILDPTVASAIIERTLGGEADGDPAAGPLGDVERGVLAYAIGRWLAGSGWSVLSVLAHAAAIDDALLDDRVHWPLELAIADARGPATLLLSGPPPPPDPSFARAATTPIELSAVAGEAILRASELASLRPGDVLLPDRVSVEWAHGGWSGEVELRDRSDRPALRCRLADGALTHEGAAPRSSTAVGRRWETAMNESKRTLEEMGDTPVTITIELARFELTLADLAALSPGEVVTSGCAIGGEVTLRAGDRVMARGELVEVDGEVGVRVRAVGG